MSVAFAQLAQYSTPRQESIPSPQAQPVPTETLRRLHTETLWIMGDRDENLPLPETLRALAALPAKESGLLTLVRFAEADHGMRDSLRGPKPVPPRHRGKRGVPRRAGRRRTSL